MKRKGVCYDVGRVLEGNLTRPTFDTAVVHRELEIIKNDMHCNAVRICGFDLERVTTAAEDAIGLGLEVVFSPEMFEESMADTHDYIVEGAAAAERLRQQSPQLIFSLGSELTIFMQGIVEGSNLMERMGNPTFWTSIQSGAHNKPLNEFLAKANEAVKKAYHGQVTYMSVPLEVVDWSSFDYIGVDLYREKRNHDIYGQMIQHRFLNQNKPVLIGEFGCCTYQGAEDAGSMGWAIMDWEATPMRLNGDYVRDEGLQARELSEQLGILNAVGVEGAFVFNFVTPTAPYSADPKYDLDMANYTLVKSYPEGHGTTYPDMTWEPKESFYAVADFYANH